MSRTAALAEDLKAFKEQTALHPNYGKASGMTLNHWWGSIIKQSLRSSIEPAMTPEDEERLKTLTPALVNRFQGKAGYRLHEDAVSLLRHFKEQRGSNDQAHDTIIGVVSNSDARVPGILSDLGLQVSPVSYDTDTTSKDLYNDDIQFTVLSYHADCAKPDPRIFKLAEQLARRVGLQDDKLAKLYIGDEYEKDAVCANNAGWDAIIVDRSGVSGENTISLTENENGTTVKHVRSLWPL